MDAAVGAYSGEIAALATAFCWTLSAVFFTEAGKRIGSMSMNLLRLVAAFGMYVAYGALVRGLPLPTDAPPERWKWLLASGAVGFVFGDLCLFRAYLIIGPRLSLLTMTLWPPIAALSSWAILGDRMDAGEWLGMLVTMAGVALVVSERRGEPGLERPAGYAWGLVLALLGAVGQAVGLVLSKPGAQGYDSFAAAQIRVIAGMAGFALLFVFTRWWPKFFASLKDGPGVLHSTLGALAGPFIGVSLMLYAGTHAHTMGVAATLMATTPIIIIPFSVYLYKERFTVRAVLGAVVAVAGVGLLVGRQAPKRPVAPAAAITAPAEHSAKPDSAAGK
ncbi:MAG: DMT family transporter [Planctomycetota bacterium]|nr:DMT family transporter [Planctomycetota bacterium]